MVNTLTLGSLVRRNAKLYPRRKALVYGETAVTFLEFNEKVNRLANALVKLGITKGKRVATLLPNSCELAEVYFACAKLGAAVVPINLRILPQDVTYILLDAGVEALFVASSYFALIEPTVLGQVGKIIAVDSIQTECLDYHPLLAGASSDEPEESGVGPDDTFMIIYTSGTTGKPKGCMLSHGALLAGNQNIVMTLNVKHQDSFLNVLPFYHVGDLGFFLAFFHMGATNVIIAKAEMSEILNGISTNRCTGTLLVPPLLKGLIDYKIKNGGDTSSLRFVAGGAGYEPTETVKGVKDVLGCEFFGIYAQTEAADVITSTDIALQLERPLTCGLPLPNFEWKIVDDEDKELAAGEEGELVVRGPSIMKGYWNQPEATQETFKNGWHHTGDIVKQDADGYLYMVDRKKYLIKTGALNVYPKEVETCLRDHPAIQEAAVVGVPDQKWGEALKAFVVLKAGQSLTPVQVAEWCHGRIANYKRPRWVEFVESIPYSFSGKLMKNELINRPLKPEQSTIVPSAIGGN